MPEATLQPPKRFLFGPGPTQVEPRVSEALAKQVVGPLDPYFFEVADRTRELLRSVFGTRNEVTFPISGTASSGMETAVANFFEPDFQFAPFPPGIFFDPPCEEG